MKDIWDIELRDSESNTKTKIFFEVQATALFSAFTQKDFDYVHTGPSTKGPPLRNYNSIPGVHNSSLKHDHLYIRGKAQSESKEKGYNLMIQMITNSLGDLKGSQTIFSQNKILKIDIKLSSSSMWENKVFGKEISKKKYLRIL